MTERSKAIVTAPNSLLVVGDLGVQTDLEVGPGLVSASSTLLFIKTLAFIDGETSVTLTRSEPEFLDLDHKFQWEGRLSIASTELTVSSIALEVYLSASISGEVQVKIAASEEEEPDDIVIYVAPAQLSDRASS